jgi:hypothetical protein
LDQLQPVGFPFGSGRLKVGQQQPLFAEPEEMLNGMITNDKFCLTRWGALELSWWRRPLRLRNAAD